MVKLVKLFVVLAFLPTVLHGQEGGKFITFNTNSIDFGEVDPAEGPLQCRFGFINSSAGELELAEPVSNCSCVSAELTERRLAPGQTAWVNVTFSPSGSIFRTHRTVDLYSAEGLHLQTLSVSAYVTPDENALREFYPIALGNGLRIAADNVSFGYLYWGETALKTVRVANFSDSELRLQARVLNGSGMLSVHCPETLPAGSEDFIRLEYSMRSAHEEYRSDADTVMLYIAGQGAASHIRADYILMGRLEETETVPSMRTYPSRSKLSRSLLSGRYKGSLEISNDGDAPLEIRSVSGKAKTNLRAGMSIPAGSTFKVTAASALPEFTLEVFSNDPLRPYKELIFNY